MGISAFMFGTPWWEHLIELVILALIFKVLHQGVVAMRRETESRLFRYDVERPDARGDESTPHEG